MTGRPLRRALFISGSLGKGHDVLAEACAAALQDRGVECQIVDAMRMLGQGPGAAGDWVFRRLLSVNAVYDAFHFSQLRDNGRLARLMDRLAVDWMFPHLCQAVDGFGPELVVSVFATGAGAATRLKVGRLSGGLGRRHDRLLRPPLLGPRVDRPVSGDLGGGGRIRAPLLAGGAASRSSPLRSGPSSTRHRRHGRPAMNSGYLRMPPVCCSCPGRGDWGLWIRPPPSWRPGDCGSWPSRGRTQRWNASCTTWPGDRPG